MTEAVCSAPATIKVNPLCPLCSQEAFACQPFAMLCHAIGGWGGQSDHDRGFLDAYRSLPRAGTRHFASSGHRGCPCFFHYLNRAMDPSVASLGPFRRTVGPPRVATMSRPDCGTTTARNDACSLVQPLITHGKRQMAATSGHPFSEAHCVGDAVAASQASDITARHDCQNHTQSSLWRGDTLKSGTPVGFDISASTATS